MSTPQLPKAVRSSADSQGSPWLTTFAVIGDFGNVSEKKNNLSSERVAANYVGEAIRQIGPDFIISAGDDNYMEGKREWKDFNVGKNYAPYIDPYTVSKANRGNSDALAFASDAYLASQVPRKPWNRFFTAPGNHEVGMSGGVGFMEASGRRDWSHDNYYKAALESSRVKGSVIPLAASYVKPGDLLYYDYSYGTDWMPATWGKAKEGAMAPEFYDYLVRPVDATGKVLDSLANIYMVDRNNTAYGSKNSAYAAWKKKNPAALLDPQADFLMKEAKKRDGDVAWQIFTSHYQTFSSGSNLATMDLPFFANGIDLVIGSHVHNYERLRAADSAGVQGDYIVNGVGGYNMAYYFSGKDWGASELSSPVGTAPGFQAGSSGKWGFGLVEMNQSELMYRQFNVEFTPVKNNNILQNIIGFAVDAYTGQEPISEVKVTEIDRLVLRKKDPSAVVPGVLVAAPASPSKASAGVLTSAAVGTPAASNQVAPGVRSKRRSAGKVAAAAAPASAPAAPRAALIAADSLPLEQSARLPWLAPGLTGAEQDHSGLIGLL